MRFKSDLAIIPSFFPQIMLITDLADASQPNCLTHLLNHLNLAN